MKECSEKAKTNKKRLKGCSDEIVLSDKTASCSRKGAFYFSNYIYCLHKIMYQSIYDTEVNNEAIEVFWVYVKKDSNHTYKISGENRIFLFL